jgi:4-hydroxybutyrate dehydrogenase
MKQLILNPTIYKYDYCKTFCREFRIGKDDLIITNKTIYNSYLKSNVNESAILFRENYGNGEPSDEMVEAMYENIKKISYDRVIAIGGGSILDIGKIFALGNRQLFWNCFWEYRLCSYSCNELSIKCNI